MIALKMFSVTGTAFISALVGSLAQWSNDDAVPTKIQWIIILGTATGAGLTALGGFLSSSYSKYMQLRNPK